MAIPGTTRVSPYVLQRKGIPSGEILPTLREMQKGGMGAVLCSSIRTTLSDLHLHQYNPQPFHSVASDRSHSFQQYMRFLEALAGRDFKAWLFYRKKGQLVQEISISNAGLTINGRFMGQGDLQRTLSFAAQFAHGALKAQDYKVGKNCGALVVGQPLSYPFGITGYPEVSSRFVWPGRGKHYQFKGIFPVSEFESIIAGLIDSQILTGFEIFQPALSAALKKVVFWKDLTDATFGFEMEIFPCAGDILDSLSREII